MHRSAVQQRRALPTSPFQRTETPSITTADFEIGVRVTHDRLGLGKVEAVDDEFLTVHFGDGSVRRLRATAPGLHHL